ncbi:hypothetical protein HZH66_003558 [Vespula vulgaris]|uniref:Uncharacterized protein n=1 Tax=Vespula vulgaris TaxID=7454 RepID=A0A834KEX8_VESVU|nr:hypothetical protein HZH66_003558 [Vespula vulgaris]
MDVTCRIMLEYTYATTVDAGFTTEDIRGISIDTLPLIEDKLNIFTSSSKLGGEDIPKDITILGSNMTESREM